MGEILVGRTDDDAVHTRIARGNCRTGGERIVCLELDHGPDDDAGRGEGFFEQVELGQEIRFDPFAGCVAGPQLIAAGLDDVIGRNRDVRGAAAHHSEDRREHTAHRGNLATVPIPRGGKCVVVPEQLVCAVDQMNVHGREAPVGNRRAA